MNPQQYGLMQQMGMGYAPLATGLQHNMLYGFEGAPLIGQMGLPGQLIGQSMLRNMMGDIGMTPMTNLGDMNVYDRMQNFNFTQTQNAAIIDAAKMDREQMIRTLRGISTMTGTPFGAQQRRAAGSLADSAIYASPILTQIAPDLMDELGGLRGSAAVLAQRVVQAGRYRTDPVTGQLGMSAETAGGLAKNIFQDFYERGDPREMRGVSAGQMGSLFEELQMRGMLSPMTGTVRERGMQAVNQMTKLDPVTLQRAAVNQGVVLPQQGQQLSAADLDKLTLDPSVADKIRAFDFEKVKRNLKSYAEAVSAMKDIFGGMGRPNAPMSELLQGLETLTMGGMAQIDPSRLGIMARTTFNLAKQSGMTMDGAMMLQQHAAVRAQQMGIEPMFAMQATQGSLAFGNAYRGLGMGGVPAWGMLNADQMQQLDANLRVQASGSNAANRLNTVLRIADTVGGFDTQSDAGRLVQAIRTGVSSFTDSTGQLRSVAMGEQQITDLLKGAKDVTGRATNIQESTIREMLNQDTINREYGFRYNTGDLIRREQGRAEMRPFISSQLQATLGARLRDAGMGANEASELAAGMSMDATNQLFALSEEDIRNPERRNQAMSRILRSGLEGTEKGQQFLSRMTAAGQEQFLRLTGEQFRGSVNIAATQTYGASLGTIENIHAAFNDRALAEGQKRQMDSNFTSRMQEAMASLGRGTPVQRAMQYLQDVRPDDQDKMKNLIGAAFGGVKSEEINQALIGPIQDLHRKRDRARQLQVQISEVAASDPERAANLQKELDGVIKEMSVLSGSLAKNQQIYGSFSDAGLATKAAAQGMDATFDLIGSVENLAAIRGNFGFEVTQTQSTAAAQEYNSRRKTEQEAAAVIIGRRMDAGFLNVTDADIQTEKSTAGGNISDADARARAFARKQRAINQITPAEMQREMVAGRIDPNTQAARQFALVQRQQTSPQASDEQIRAIMEGDKNMSLTNARLLGDRRQRAKRFGIEDAAIKAKMQGGMNEADAIGALIAEAIPQQYQISGQELEAAKKLDQFKGMADEDIKEALLFHKMENKRERYERFFRSEDSNVLRDVVDTQSQRMEDTISSLVSGGEMTGRMGLRAVDIHKQLKEIQARKEKLAFMYTRGDRARLEAGFYDFDTRTAFGRKSSLEVDREMAELNNSTFQLMDEINDSKDGRYAPAMSEEEEARRLLGFKPGQKLSGDDQSKLNTAKYDVSVTRKMKPDDMRLFEQYHRRQKEIENYAQNFKLTVGDLSDAISGKKKFDQIAPGELDMIAKLFGDQANAQPALNEMLKRVGVTKLSDLEGVRGVIDQRDKIRIQAQERENIRPQDLIEQFSTSFGLGPVDMQSNKGASQLVGMLGSIQSRRRLQDIIGSNEQLKSFAKVSQNKDLETLAALQKEGKGDGPEAAALRGRIDRGADGSEAVRLMLEDYKKASKTSDFSGFRSSYGLEDEGAFDAARSSLNFLSKSQFINLSKEEGRGKRTWNDVASMLQNVAMGGTVAETGSQRNGDMRISGTLLIKGEYATMDAYTGGSGLSVPIQP